MTDADALFGSINWSLFGPIASLLGPIFGAYLIEQLKKGRYAINWIVFTPKSMTDFAEEITDRLQVHLDGRPVINLTKFTFILHNSGREPIDSKAIISPIKWTGPGKIIDARVTATGPPVDLIVDVSKETVEFRWQLFNQQCQALIEVLCDVEDKKIEGEISGQIWKVPDIKRYNIRYVDEEEVLRLSRRRTSQLPGIFQRLRSERLVIWFSRHMLQILATIVWLYATMAVLMLEFNLHLGEGSRDIIMALWLSLLIVVLWFCRNPYAKLLRKRVPPQHL